ncbi:aspartate kinase [Thozetella sp. PMI_491]|nr:aspartate kinase [Thozetella sp. PMI_491]
MVFAVSTPSRPWLIQKYGGTSLGNHLSPICEKIIPLYMQKFRVAVVCSAISGKAKTTGTTSLLLRCIGFTESGTNFQGDLNQTVDLIKNAHFGLLERHIQTINDISNDLYPATRKRVSNECETLRRFLLAAQILGELSPRAKDRVISVGEKLSSIVVSARLVSKGIPSHIIALDDLVETVFGPDIFEQKSQFDSLYSRFYHRLSREIGERIHDAGDSVPVITGFFGIMPEPLLKTVGRGYSDLCAAMCALGVGASELQIWKEVDGIFTADPRKVPSARLLSTVTVEEATELTYYGSEVIHPLTMDQIKCANIPLRLKNVSNPEGPGTIIYPSYSSSLGLDTSNISQRAEIKLEHHMSGFMLENGYHGEDQERRTPTAVTVKDSITLINVACNRNTKSRGFLAKVLTHLEENGIAIDLVTTSERNISLAVQASEDGNGAERKAEIGLERFGKVASTRNMSIVTVVGNKMRNMVGISSEILGVLAASKINIYLISQGATEINVSLVVGAKDAILAMNVIHGKVLGIPTHWEQENNFIKGIYICNIGVSCI